MPLALGLFLVHVIGGLLSQTDLHLQYSFGLLHLDRFSTPFLFAALLGLIVLFIVMKWLKNTTRVHKFTTQKVRLRFTFTKYFAVLLVLSFVIQFVVTLFETVFSIYGKDELGFNSNQIGIGFMLCGSIMAVLQPVFATYGEKFLSTKKQIALGLFISGLSLIVFPFFKNEYLVYVLIIMFAAGGALVTPNLLSAVSLTSKENTGRNISIQSATGSVGQILGPVVGTWLIADSFYYPFIIAGLIVIISIGLVRFVT